MSSLDWNPDAASRVKNGPCVTEDGCFDVPVGMNTLFLLTSAP